VSVAEIQATGPSGVTQTSDSQPLPYPSHMGKGKVALALTKHRVIETYGLVEA